MVSYRRSQVNEADKVLGRKIAALRIANDYSIKMFARAIGGNVTVQELERFESGKKVIPLRTLEKIFRIFDSHVDRKLWRRIGNERQAENPSNEELARCYELLFDDEDMDI